GLAYLWAWTDWIPLALRGARIVPGSGTPTHLPGLLCPAFAAVLVTAVADGWPGVIALARRLVLVSRPIGRFVAYSLNPISFLALGLLVMMASSAPLPAAAASLPYPGLATMGLLATFLIALFVNGFGEETGW